jgi:rSAM/selenodomain-associated transferase 1
LSEHRISHRRRLIVFARAPVAGRVKTGLCPPLSGEEAAVLAEAFLLDEVETFQSLPGCRLSVAFTPNDGSGVFRRILGDEMIPWLAPQGAGSLGDRLLSAFNTACPSWWPVAVIGCDTPDLPEEYIEDAFRELEADAADVVIGPTREGGYYLIAARQAHPALFQDMPWNTPALLAATVERAQEAGLRPALLPVWEEVDVLDNLMRMRDRLEGAPPLRAPRTRAVLRRLGF